MEVVASLAFESCIGICTLCGYYKIGRTLSRCLNKVIYKKEQVVVTCSLWAVLGHKVLKSMSHGIQNSTLGDDIDE